MKNNKDIMYVKERHNKRGELSFELHCSGKDAFTKKYKVYVRTYKVPNDLKGKKEIEKLTTMNVQEVSVLAKGIHMPESEEK